MKFVFLGAGKIAQLFLEKQQREFGSALELVGIVAPENVAGFYRGQDGFLSRAAFLPLNLVNRQEAALQELLRAVKPDFVLAVQYSWILSPKVLELVRGRVLNLHNARLPQYRGHNVISHEILNREQVHTSTLHWMAEEVDRGRIVLTRDIAIAPDDTAFSLWRRSVDAATVLLAQFVNHCETIVYEQVGQPVAPGGVYYSKTDIQAFKHIPDDASFDDIDRIARAFWFPPHEPAYFLNGHRRLYVLPGAYEYSTKMADL